MNKKVKIALSGLGLAGAVAVPLAIVACASNNQHEFTAEDRELLLNTTADNWGSQKWNPKLMDLVEGKTLSVTNTDGTSTSSDTYAVFIGTTACPVCNNLLTNTATRNNYSEKQNVNAYAGPYSLAVQKLQSDQKIQRAFIWEDLAGGYGDTDQPNGSQDFFPWSEKRGSDTSAKTFRAVENYFQVSKYRSPFVFVVIKNVVKVVSIKSSDDKAPPTQADVIKAFSDQIGE